MLRKDFTVSALNVADARLMGADCLLLIVAALEVAELADLHRLAIEVGLDVLVEIHDEPELDVALAAGAMAIGVNQRDLTTFEVTKSALSWRVYNPRRVRSRVRCPWGTTLAALRVPATTRSASVRRW